MQRLHRKPQKRRQAEVVTVGAVAVVLLPLGLKVIAKAVIRITVAQEEQAVQVPQAVKAATVLS